MDDRFILLSREALETRTRNEYLKEETKDY